MLIALPKAFGDAATNMAIDAALLETIPKGLAAFRHYAWLEPAATFGYAQKYADVASELTSGHEPVESAQASLTQNARRARASSHATITRRLTGGGIVDHRNDWTYALILHHSLSAVSTPATDLYEQIHHAISQTLAKMDIESHLAPCPKACDNPHPASRIPYPASRCFVTPAANDVLRPDGQKIAGAAMKRSRSGLLIQGSLDRAALPETFDYAIFQQNLIPQLATAFEIPTGELEDLRPLFNSECIEREKQRFASEVWNQKR